MSVTRRIVAALSAFLIGATVAVAQPAQAAPPPQPDAAVLREPLPPGFDGQAPAPLPAAVAHAEMAANAIRCEGDGVTGKRVEVLYVREAAQPDRYALYLPSFRTYLAGTDDAFNDSAAKTGGSRHIRFVTEAAGGGCQIAVRNVVVANGTFTGNNWATIKAAVAQQGYNRTDRKYMLFDENTPVCGGADPDNDETPGPTSRWNLGPRYLEIGPGCWGTNAAGHELGHLFGAVRDSAPHADGGAHCTEEWDLMCYGAIQTWPCGEKADDRLLDCGNDDYFHTSPPAGSYLATHWNSANSEFLIKGSTPDNDDGHLRGGRSYVITNAATGHAMEPIDGSTALFQEMSQRPVSGAQSQRWLLNYATGWQLVNVATQLCLDDYYSQTAPGTTTLQYYCSPSNGMHWALQPLGNGRHSMVNYKTGLALTSQGTHPAKLAQYAYTGALTQQWTLTPVTEAAPVAGATYTFTSRFARNLAVAANTSGTDAGHAAIAPATTSQRWTLQAGSAAGRFRIVNAASGLCLRPKSSATAAGARVEQVTCGTAANLEWTVRRYADTRYGFTNRSTGYALALLDGSTGSFATQEPYQGGDASNGDANRVWGLIRLA